MRRPRALLNRYGDIALVCALALLGECELAFRQLNTDFPGPRAVNAVLVVAMAVPVAWRRRAPLEALIVFWVPVQIWLDVFYGPHGNLPLEPFIALLVLLYSAATYESGIRGRAVACVLAAIYLSELALLAFGKKGVGNLVPGLVFITLAYVIGRGLRRRQIEEGRLRRRAIELDAERDTFASAAVEAERDRIARELHDVIAHSVSVIVVQAGAGERLLERDPDAAMDAFRVIRAAGSDALDELRRLLGLLRDTDGSDPDGEPAPGLERLDLLIAEARATGLAVDCAVEGTPRPLPAGVDLAAYRIVQEALTNVRKHAQAAAHTEIRVHYGPGELRLSVENDGAGSASPSTAPGAGHGLIGMRERVALYGGTLQNSRREDGGYRILASLPLDGVSR